MSIISNLVRKTFYSTYSLPPELVAGEYQLDEDGNVLFQVEELKLVLRLLKKRVTPVVKDEVSRTNLSQEYICFIEAAFLKDDSGNWIPLSHIDKAKVSSPMTSEDGTEKLVVLERSAYSVLVNLRNHMKQAFTGQIEGIN